MRKLVVVLALVLLPLATARAQSCPGVAPWVFVDVAASHSFCTYVTWMAQRNVTTGCRIIDANNREYCPDDSVSRLQMAAFMFRLGDALFPRTCAAGQVMKWNGAAWTCSDDNIGGSGGGGTVTSVLAGTGLTASPNPIVGAGVINLALGYQLPQACANGQVAKSNGAGGWTCAADIDTNAGGTVTSLTQGSGIVLAPNPIVAAGTISADTTYLQRRVSASCAVGSSIRVIAADGSVTCETDVVGPANAFVQNGNAFGAPAVLGTTDNFALDVRVNNARVMRYEPNAISPNVIGGSPANNVTPGVRGATIAGGGVPAGDTDPDLALEAPNRVTDAFGTVSGGFANRAGDDAGTTIDAPFATVGGGWSNTASGELSTVGGGFFNTSSGGFSTVGGGYQNTASSGSSTVGGGWSNTASDSGVVSGGASNDASGLLSTVGGGNSNDASGPRSTVGGGTLGAASAYASTVGGGYGNTASGENSTVGGGYGNTASGENSTVGGGVSNIASGLYSSVGGGGGNTASGDYSWAGGRRARTRAVGGAHHNGAFVWADNSNFDFRSSSTNEFAARATGGVRFVTAIDGTGAATRTVSIDPNGELSFGAVTRQMLNLYDAVWGIGVQPSTVYFRSGNHFGWYLNGVHTDSPLDPGANGATLMTLTNGASTSTVTGTLRAQVVTATSDRAQKLDFAAVDGQEVLARVVALPIETWAYRNEPGVRHMGPSGQAFQAAFGLGHDDKSIATVDADGVALTAIQGLNAKLEAKLAEKDREIAELKEQFSDVRAMQAEVVALKDALAELRRERAALATR